MKKRNLILAGLASAVLLMAASVIGYQDWQLRGSTPSNPASGYLRVWADNAAGKIKCLTSGGAACYFDSATSGTVTSIATTSPITGGTITSTGTIACASCVTSSSPGAGIAHFAGSTQAVTSSSVVSADLNITTTSCTAPAVITAIGATGTGTCTTIPLTQNSQSAAYTTVLGDAGKHIYHPSADTTARTWTIDSNANVAYPIGTTLTFVNDTSAGTVTIAITSDTLVLAGTGTTGSRTLAAGGVATALKVTSTRWIINGNGLT